MRPRTGRRALGLGAVVLCHPMDVNVAQDVAGGAPVAPARAPAAPRFDVAPSLAWLTAAQRGRTLLQDVALPAWTALACLANGSTLKSGPYRAQGGARAAGAAGAAGTGRWVRRERAAVHAHRAARRRDRDARRVGAFRPSPAAM